MPITANTRIGRHIVPVRNKALLTKIVNVTSPEVGKELGQRICRLRRALSYTQEDLAERAGISVSFLSMIERGERLPHIDTLASLASALGVTLSDLFVGVNDSSGNHQALLPLITCLQNLRLDANDVEALMSVAKAMFKERA